MAFNLGYTAVLLYSRGAVVSAWAFIPEVRVRSPPTGAVGYMLVVTVPLLFNYICTPN